MERWLGPSCWAAAQVQFGLVLQVWFGFVGLVFILGAFEDVSSEGVVSSES